ncbi:MAG TPA: extracellular solute-binding protein [bacterium]|nr:extracellular solute-binding protein [bacterium]
MGKGLAALAWVACALLFAACARPGTTGGARGGAVSVLGVWGGSELDSFRAMVKPFETRTGITVQYEGTRDLNAVLTARVQGGHPPDLAALPGPGQIAELARAGSLKPLDHAVDPGEMAREYTRTWIDLGSVGGRLYSIVIKTAVKGLVWYDPHTWAAAGYQVPSTWGQLLSLTQAIASGGKTAWCVGLESGAATGWPATDWIEILLLRAAGPGVYEQWYRHEIPWTDPRVRAAWQRFGQIAANPKNVYGGTPAELATNFGQAPFPMFVTPPGCYMHLQATFIQDFIHTQYPQLQPGRDVAFFPFPTIAPAYATDVEVAGDLVGMFNDTPQARALVRYLATAAAQEIWVKRGAALSPNRGVPLTAYPDSLSRRAAEMLVTSDAARFDASDMMPQAVTDAFYKATLDYVRDPARLTEILRRLEQVSRENYK